MHHLDNHGSTIIISHFEPYLLVMVLLDGCFFLLIYSYLLEILQPSTVWSLRISGISVISFFSNLLSFFLSLSISSYPPVSLNFSLSLSAYRYLTLFLFLLSLPSTSPLLRLSISHSRYPAVSDFLQVHAWVLNFSKYHRTIHTFTHPELCLHTRKLAVILYYSHYYVDFYRICRLVSTASETEHFG